VSASASDVPRAIVFATVAGDRREARDHGGLLGRHGADLVQSGDQRDRGDRSDGGNRGENIKTPGEDGITGDRALDLDIEVGDRTSGKRSNPQGDTRYPPRAPPLSREAPDVEFATANFSVNWMRQRRWCLG
jgi:hypothetical protein